MVVAGVLHVAGPHQIGAVGPDGKAAAEATAHAAAARRRAKSVLAPRQPARALGLTTLDTLHCLAGAGVADDVTAHADARSRLDPVAARHAARAERAPSRPARTGLRRYKTVRFIRLYEKPWLS